VYKLFLPIAILDSFDIVTGIMFIGFSSPSHRRRNPSLNLIYVSLVKKSKLSIQAQTRQNIREYLTRRCKQEEA
jgi:hypothetical protein